MAQNNGDIFDATGLKQIFQMLLDQSNGQPETLAKNAVTNDILKVIRDTAKDTSKVTEKELDKFSKTLLSELRSMFGGSAALTSYIKLMTELLKEMAANNKGTLNETQIANRVVAALSNAFQASYDAKRSGQGTVYINYDSSKAKGDPGAQKLISTFIPQHLVKINSTIEKVLDFWNEHKAGEKARQRRFVDDLVEGLAKSKWVGGVLMDLVKLASYFAANWLKQFGPIGKALAVGVIAAAPIIGEKIAGILVKAIGGLISGIGRMIGSVFKAGLLGIGTLIKATLMSFTKSGVLTRAMTSPASGAFRTNLAIGSFLAAGAVGMMAADSFKQGDNRNKWAGGILGLGSAAFGTAGIASLLAPIFPLLAPIAPIALAVAAVATGIGMIVKFWPQIMDFFKSVLQFLGIIAKDGEETGGEKVRKPGLVDKVANVLSGKGASSTSAELLKGKTDKGGHLDPNKFTKEEWDLADKLSPVYGKKGEIVNLGQMTQRRASEVIEADIVKHEKAGTQSFYERVGRDLADVDQFGTDLRSSDGNYVYMARGFSDWWRATLDKAEQAGYDTGGGRITSGMGSLGREGNVSPHTYTDSWRGHFSSSGLTFDAPKFIDKKTGRYLTEKEYQALGITYAYTEGDHDHLAIPGFVSQEEHAKDLAIEEKSGIIEAAKKSIAIQKEELKQAEEEADADGKRTLREKWNIVNKQVDLETMEGDLGLLNSEAATKKMTSITGMKQLRDCMHSKVFRDLLEEAIASSTGQ